MDHVVAETARDDVVAALAEDHVGARAGQDHVVAVALAERVDRIVVGGSVNAQRLAPAVDFGVAVLDFDKVAARAAFDEDRAAMGCDPVVAVAAKDGHIAGPVAS